MKWNTPQISKQRVKRIYHQIRSMKDGRGLATIHFETLAKTLKMSQSAISQGIKVLIREGRLVRMERGTNYNPASVFKVLRQVRHD